MLKSKLDSCPTAYTFDDFVLIPNHSEVESRKAPDVSVRFMSETMNIPVFSSPMNTVTEEEMLVTMYKAGGTGVLHRYVSVEDQVSIVKSTAKRLSDMGAANPMGFFVSVGASKSKERLEALAEAGVSRFCVDVANGHSSSCLDAVMNIKEMLPDAIVMAGNVCTYDGAMNLAEVGADALRVGIGSGSVCTTRVVTGHGVPQLTAIEQCARIKSVHPYVNIISDGGIRSSGDVVKALAAGSDSVMLGSLLAGSSDTPGDVQIDSDGAYKYYNGMASEAARSSWFDRTKTAWVPEGESIRIPFKGETEDILNGLIGGLKVGMSYTGAHDLEELRHRARWVRVTGAGLIEGTPHGKVKYG